MTQYPIQGMLANVTQAGQVRMSNGFRAGAAKLI
jgi:hypothetical protein